MRVNLWVGSCVFLSVLGGCGGGGGDAVLVPLQNAGNTSGTNAPANNSGTSGTGGVAETTGAANTGSGTSGTSATPSAGGGTSSANTGNTSSGNSDTTGATSSSGTTTPSTGTTDSAPVVITAVTAPQDGATLNGNVFLKIEGTNIQNAELLPAGGYTPRLGVFVVAPDRRSASLVFNTTTIPNGTLRVRISAFNLPPGAAGASEVVAMAPRTWRFDNQPPPFGTQEGRAARCQMMGFPYTDPSADLPVVCITGTPTSTPPQQCSNLGTGYGNPEDLLPVLRNSTPVSKLYCEPGANGGVVNTGCVCLS